MAFPCPPRNLAPGCDPGPGCTTDPPTVAADLCPVGCELGPCSPEERADLSRAVRAAAANESVSPRSHPCNCDEIEFQASAFNDRFIASFTKGLPHNPLGEVLVDPYCRLLRALGSGNPLLFEEVALGCCPDCETCPEPCPPPSGVPAALECRIRRRMLENPQAAFAYDLEGFDSHALCLPPAPKFSSAEEIAEIAENYWSALARDVPFSAYATDPLIAQAAADLAGYACIQAPVDPPLLFRGLAPGSEVGPYISQFLYMDTPYGAQFIPARIRTLQPHVDYLTAYDEWLAVQDGCDREQSACDDTPRFIRNGRDLAQYVHVDLTFNAFLAAALQLLSPDEPLRRCEARPGRAVEFARCLPYVNPAAPFEEQFPGKSANQIGFATFGAPHLVSLLVETMDRALKAVWYQKWSVHRRLRPEEFGGRIHNTTISPPAAVYPFDPANYARLQATVLPLVFAHNERQNRNLRRFPAGGTYLLPQAYAEGSPLHPSYGSGHSTVAGALGTILKAFFPGEHLILNPVVPTDDGTALTAFDPGGDTALTVEGEINKVVDNIGLGRIIAGVHWRSDHTESIRLGEAVALSILCNQRNTYNEAFEMRLRRFDGTWVRIRPGGICPETLEEEPGSCMRTRTSFLCSGGGPEL
jgi:hypothetical protein